MNAFNVTEARWREAAEIELRRMMPDFPADDIGLVLDQGWAVHLAALKADNREPGMGLDECMPALRTLTLFDLCLRASRRILGFPVE